MSDAEETGKTDKAKYAHTIVLLFNRLLQRMKSEWIQDVPEEVGACEFECRKLQCKVRRARVCKRRLKGIYKDNN